MARIQSLRALEVLDSRGNPTVRVFCALEAGVRVTAAVAMRASSAAAVFANPLQ